MTSICIFGSVARKDQDALSDKDALILFDGTETCKHLNKDWGSKGWSVANYTSNRLSKMANAGSLFIQHLKQEGIILQDTGDVLGDILASYKPKSDYSDQVNETISALKLLEHVPRSHELGYWSADLLHVLIRNLGILKLANEGIYEFSFRCIADQLVNLGLIGTDDLETFESLRAAKSAYRSRKIPVTPAHGTVEGGLRIIDKLSGIALERNHELILSAPDMRQPYFNLRAMEKILVACNGLPQTDRSFVSPSERRIWKQVMDPRAYSWDIKTRQPELWQMLQDSINPSSNLYNSKHHDEISYLDNSKGRTTRAYAG